MLQRRSARKLIAAADYLKEVERNLPKIASAGRVAIPVARQRARVYARSVSALTGLWFDRR